MIKDEAQENEKSRLFRIVQTIAISPEDAQRVVENCSKQSKEKYPDDAEWQHKSRVADKIIKRYSKQAALIGSATALTGIVPGIGTIVAQVVGTTADTAVSMKLQVDMCLCLADVFGYDITDEDVRHLVFLISVAGSLEKVGSDIGFSVGSKAGVRMLRQYLQGAALQTIKQMFRRIGITFTRKALEKSIPFGVGVVIGGGANYALTRYVGREAKKWFIIDSGDPNEEAGYSIPKEPPPEPPILPLPAPKITPSPSLQG